MSRGLLQNDAFIVVNIVLEVSKVFIFSVDIVGINERNWN